MKQAGSYRRRTLSRIFAVPALLAAISLVGLLSALMADGLWDGLSWVALAIVVVTIAWFAWIKPVR